MRKLALFASGNGSNTQNIIQYFSTSEIARVEIVLSNNCSAPVLEKSWRLNVEAVCFNKKMFYESDQILNLLHVKKIDWIILAGFLWLVPSKIINAFENKVINIHPALLPKYGGKGMYGIKVHEFVLQNNENETGITIHYVNIKYDEGKIIFQKNCPVFPDDTAEKIADRVHQLEYEFYPKIIEQLIINE